MGVIRMRLKALVVIVSCLLVFALASSGVAAGGAPDRTTRSTAPPVNVVLDWTEGQAPVEVSNDRPRFEPLPSKTVTIPYVGKPVVVQIKPGENPEEVLKTVTREPYSAHMDKAPTDASISSTYPDCSWSSGYPCYRHGDAVIDWVGSLYTSTVQIGPYNQYDPCNIPDGCNASSTASATIEAEFTSGLQIGKEVVQASTGFNLSLSINYSQTNSIKIYYLDSGGIYPRAIIDHKNFGDHRDNYLCDVWYDPMGAPYETCTLDGTTYSSGTASQPEWGIDWYTWYRQH